MLRYFLCVHPSIAALPVKEGTAQSNKIKCKWPEIDLDGWVLCHDRDDHTLFPSAWQSLCFCYTKQPNCKMQHFILKGNKVAFCCCGSIFLLVLTIFFLNSLTPLPLPPGPPGVCGLGNMTWTLVTLVGRCGGSTSFSSREEAQRTGLERSLFLLSWY